MVIALPLPPLRPGDAAGPWVIGNNGNTSPTVNT